MSIWFHDDAGFAQEMNIIIKPNPVKITPLFLTITFEGLFVLLDF